MLTLYGPRLQPPFEATSEATEPEGTSWIDAFDPNPTETSFIERVMGTRVPKRQELEEIESSSRLSTQGEVLLMSLPATTRDAEGYPITTPIGFLLGRERLTTIRFAHLPSFDTSARQADAAGSFASGGFGALVAILELIVDHIADVLERVGADLDTMSQQIFSVGLVPGKDRRPKRANEALTRMLKSIGTNGDLVSKVSQSLLSLNRMVPFLASKCDEQMSDALRKRLDTIGQDAKSLREFEDQLASKTQFLLDGVLGVANIEQNNVFRVLTIVSVVGIPPTFLASMYGMNFKNMPEYDWSFGYQYGLTLIVLSGLLPAIWFKVKGWW